MTTLTRIVIPFQVKAAADVNGRHTFEGLAAVWDQDLGNDIIHKGAFKQTLKDWKASGEAMPLLNSHDHWDIFSALGQMIEAKETDEGLWSLWELIDGEEGDRVFRRLQPSPTTNRPLIGKMSIGFEPLEWNFEQPEGTTGFFDRIRHLTKVNLAEVSLVLFPMAPGASIDASTVKAFIASAQNTDPTKLSPETKMELRRLASRIGTLLKKQPSPTADRSAEEDPDVPDGEGEVAGASAETRTPTPAPPAQPDDATDPARAATPTTQAAASTDASTTETEKGRSTVYPYGEALQQRIQGLRLKLKVSEIGAQQ